MKTESYTITVEYKVFDVGEKVRPNSPRACISPGIYTVKEYSHPNSGEDAGSIILEEEPTGYSSYYFSPYAPGDRFGVESFDCRLITDPDGGEEAK